MKRNKINVLLILSIVTLVSCKNDNKISSSIDTNSSNTISSSSDKIESTTPEKENDYSYDVKGKVKVDYNKIGFGSKDSNKKKSLRKDKKDEGQTSSEPFHFIGLDNNYDLEEAYFDYFGIDSSNLNYSITDYNDFNGFIHASVMTYDDNISEFSINKSSSYLPEQFRCYSHMNINYQEGSLFISKKTGNAYHVDVFSGKINIFLPFDDGFYVSTDEIDENGNNMTSIYVVVENEDKLDVNFVYSTTYFNDNGLDAATFLIGDKYGNLYLNDINCIYSPYIDFIYDHREWAVASRIEGLEDANLEDISPLLFDPYNMIFFKYQKVGNEEKVYYLNGPLTNDSMLEVMEGETKETYDPYKNNMLSSSFAFNLWEGTNENYSTLLLSKETSSNYETPLSYGLLKLAGNDNFNDSYKGSINGYHFFYQNEDDSIIYIKNNGDNHYEIGKNDKDGSLFVESDELFDDKYPIAYSSTVLAQEYKMYENRLYISYTNNRFTYVKLTAEDEAKMNDIVNQLYEDHYDYFSNVEKITNDEQGNLVYYVRVKEYENSLGKCLMFTDDSNSFIDASFDNIDIATFEFSDSDSYVVDKDGNRYLLDEITGLIVDNKRDLGYQVYELFEAE